MPTVAFTATRAENETIRHIVNRAIAMAARRHIDIDSRDAQMDICAVHSNGCPLRLNELLEADDFNFSHDVFGIFHYIDRRTGKLAHCFVPRFAVPQPGVKPAPPIDARD